MSEMNIEARGRYYAEVSLKLSKAGFAPQPQEDVFLSVDRHKLTKKEFITALIRDALEKDKFGEE